MSKDAIWKEKRKPPLSDVMAALQEEYADWRDVETRVYVLEEPLRSALTGDQLLEVLGSRIDPDLGHRPKPLPGGAHVEGMLIVCNTPGVHDQVERALRELRHLLAPEKFSPPESPEEAAVRRVEEALEQPTSFDFGETTLAEAAEFISRKHRLDVRLDTPALDSVGIGADTPVSFVPQQMPLKTALRLLLRDLDLTYIVRGETLTITTRDSGGWPAAQFYLVPKQLEARVGRRWIEPVAGSVGVSADLEDLKSMGIYVYGDIFVTCQMDETHRQIRLLLTALERAVQQPADQTERIDVWPPPDDFARRTRIKLKQLTSIHAGGREFAKIVEGLAERNDVPIVIDVPALDALAIDPDAPVELEIANVPLREALSALAAELGLTMVVDRGVIEITTHDKAWERLPLRIYPVKDLLQQPRYNAELLTDDLMSATGRENWWRSGGPGGISELGGVLVVRATHQVHARLEESLASLRSRGRTTGQR